MKKNIKDFLISEAIFIVVSTILLVLMGALFPTLDVIYQIIIAVMLATILSPRVESFPTSTGTRYKIKSIFKRP